MLRLLELPISSSALSKHGRAWKLFGGRSMQSMRRLHSDVQHNIPATLIAFTFIA